MARGRSGRFLRTGSPSLWLWRAQGPPSLGVARKRSASTATSLDADLGGLASSPPKPANDLHLEQHQHALMSSHPGIEAEPSRERTLQDPHLIAGLELGALGQLDQPVALTLAEIIDDVIGDARA